MDQLVTSPATQIAEYSPTAAALADLRGRFANVVFDVATRDGMKEAVAARAEIRGYRTDLERMRVEIKAPALERCRLIDAEAKRITAELIALEQPIDSTIKVEEQRKAAEKAAKEAAERERVAALVTRVNDIRHRALGVAGKSAAAITKAIADLTALDIGEDFAEYIDGARIAKLETLGRMGEALAERKLLDDEATRIAAEKAELARLRAEQEAAAAAARAVAEAAAAAERAEIARVKAEQDAADAARRAAAEEAAAIDRAEAEKRLSTERAALAAQQAAADAEIAARRAAADAELKAQRAAQEAAERAAAARIAEQRAAIEAEQAEIARKKREQQAEIDAARAVAEAKRIALVASDPVETLRAIGAIADDDEIHDATARAMITDLVDAAIDAALPAQKD